MATTESTPPAAPSSGVTTPRYVPGAPPPAPPSKSKKKKTKSALKNLAASAHEAALSDHAPDAEDIKAGKVDPSLLANPAPLSTGGADTGNNTDADVDDKEAEKSLTVEAITKRIKALGKKVQRAKEYKDQTEALNEDQKAVVAQLPSLESTIKELEGVKKTVETFEATNRRTQAQQRAEERKATEQRINEAAQHAEASLLPRITSLLSFLSLRNLLTHATPTDLSISEPERNAILSAGEALLANPPVGHVEEIVKGFLTGAGSWEDIECKSYSRLLEITSQFAAPRAPTPIPDPSIPLDPTATQEPEPEPEEPEELEPEPEIKQEIEEPVVLGLAQPPTTGGGFHFMQESELDAPGMTESQEWVSVAQPETVQSEDVAEEVEAVQEDVGFVGTEAGATVGADAAGGAPLDWAAGEHDDELPDLGGLQATFGGSGSATPVPPQPQPQAQKSVTIDDDGFTAIPNRRGSQRGAMESTADVDVVGSAEMVRDVVGMKAEEGTAEMEKAGEGTKVVVIVETVKAAVGTKDVAVIAETERDVGVTAAAGIVVTVKAVADTVAMAKAVVAIAAVTDGEAVSEEDAEARVPVHPLQKLRAHR